MRILITGATGLIGVPLSKRLFELGHEIIVLTRDEKKAKDIFKLPFNYLTISKINKKLGPIDVLINLAGETIDQEWTREAKQKMYKSRVHSIKYLLETLKMNDASPKRVISASAIGYYGDHKDKLITEKVFFGMGFLADLANHWEYMVKHKSPINSDVIILRLGMVLSHKEGVLKKMHGVFNKNLGSFYGTGEQYWSWVSLEDAVEAFVFSVGASFPERINIFNVVGGYCQSKEFSLTLSQYLEKWCFFKISKFMLGVILGSRSELLISSQRVSNQKITSLGFEFKDTNLLQLIKKEYPKILAVIND